MQGYFLLFESMLDSVLHARDLYLADGGSGRSHIAPVQILLITKDIYLRICVVDELVSVWCINYYINTLYLISDQSLQLYWVVKSWLSTKVACGSVEGRGSAIASQCKCEHTIHQEELFLTQVSASVVLLDVLVCCAWIKDSIHCKQYRLIHKWFKWKIDFSLSANIICS